MQPITCSVKDAARAIGIGHVTLYKLINAGKLDTVKVGKRRLIKVDSIHKLVEAA